MAYHLRHGTFTRICSVLGVILLTMQNFSGLKPISYGHSVWLQSQSQKLRFFKIGQQRREYETPLQTVYRKNWVGFPEIAGSDCKMALYSQTRNSLYPQFVTRTNETTFENDTTNCERFIEKYGFGRRYPTPTKEELNFPLAFIILFHKNMDQVMFLLRAIYHAHNVYCLSVDMKSHHLIQPARSVAKCLPNVFVASKLEKIVYAGFSRLMADINCMQDLLKHPVQWRYVQNMPGEQFPLRTNLEVVKILKLLKGQNDVEGITAKEMLIEDRFLYRYEYLYDKHIDSFRLSRTKIKNDPPPHGLKVVKGSTYGSFSRAFVDFAIHDPLARDLLEWSKSVASPDEYFWSTLHHSKLPSIPGGYMGDTNKEIIKWITSFSLWTNNQKRKCTTLYIRDICIFSPQDLSTVLARNTLYANKFYMSHHPAALHCLDEMLVNLTYSRTVRNMSTFQNILQTRHS